MITRITDSSTCHKDIIDPIYYSSYCLALVTEPQSKNNAQDICHGYGGILVEIETAAMQIFVSTAIVSRMNTGLLEPAYWWIGVSVDTSTRYWEWTDGRKIYFY